MGLYKIPTGQMGDSKSIRKFLDGEFRVSIPNDPANNDWNEYIAWKAAGNTPDPADPIPEPPPTQAEQLDTLIEQATTALGSVGFTPGQQALLANVFAGMKSIYGSQG